MKSFKKIIAALFILNISIICAHPASDITKPSGSFIAELTKEPLVPTSAMLWAGLVAGIVYDPSFKEAIKPIFMPLQGLFLGLIMMGITKRIEINNSHLLSSANPTT